VVGLDRVNGIQLGATRYFLNLDRSRTFFGRSSRGSWASGSHRRLTHEHVGERSSSTAHLIGPCCADLICRLFQPVSKRNALNAWTVSRNSTGKLWRLVFWYDVDYISVFPRLREHEISLVTIVFQIVKQQSHSSFTVVNSFQACCFSGHVCAPVCQQNLSKFLAQGCGAPQVVDNGSWMAVSTPTHTHLHPNLLTRLGDRVQRRLSTCKHSDR
jgi:hypothetical protein